MEVGAEPQNEATLVLASPQNRHLQQRLPGISVAAQLPQATQDVLLCSVTSCLQ